MAGGQRVDGRAHVHEQRLDRVGIGVADGGDDFFVYIAGEWIPVPFGGVAAEDGGLGVVHAVADAGDAEGGEFAGHIGEVERFAFAAVVAEGAGDTHTALPVEVTEHGVDGVPCEHVVESVGVLTNAAMDIYRGVFAIAGQLAGDSGDIVGFEAADGAPVDVGFFERGFLDELHRGLDPRAVRQGRVHEQVAGYDGLGVVRVEGNRLAVAHDEQELFIVLDGLGLVLRVRYDAVFSLREACVGGADERARFAGGRIDFHQPAGVGVAFLAGPNSGGFVCDGKERLVEPVMLDHPADDRHAQRAVGTRLDGQPFPCFAGELGESRVNHSDLGVAGGEVFGEPDGAVGGAVVGFKEVSADEKDEPRPLKAGLPVKLLAARERAGFILLAHSFAGEIQRALADGGVTMEVGRAVAGAEPFHEVLAPALHAPPAHHELVVLGAEVGMIGINQLVEVRSVFFFEPRDGHSLVPNPLHVVCHFLRRLVIRQRPDRAQPLDVPVFLAGHIGKQFAALDNLGDRLLE